MNRLAALAYSFLSSVAFVLSLIYFTYFYAIRLRDTTNSPGSPIANLAFNVGLFTIFAGHHSLMARTGAKRWLARFVRTDLERSTYVWVASILFTLTCFFWRDLPGSAYVASGWLRPACFAVQLSGVALIVWAVSVLDVLALAGIRQVEPSWSADKDSSLRVRGPYHWIRHPIYLGWILAMFGAPDMPSGRLAFAIMSTAYLTLAIPWEERSMMNTFGHGYRRYVARVRWRMIPWLY